MCGIVGWVSKSESFALGKWADDALLMNSVRGDHSTGVMFSAGKNTGVFKKSIAGYDFIQLKQYKKKKINHGFFIGHNRYATIGDHSDDNAHPFETKDWVGVHNGSLAAGWKGYLPSGFEVDSEAIVHSVQDVGIKNTVELLKGAYSLVLFNKQNSLLYFARNNERPMFIATLKDGKVFFGSDEHIIRCACVRHGYLIDKMYSTEVGVIYSVNIDGKIEKVDEFNITKSIQEDYSWNSCSYGGTGVANHYYSPKASSKKKDIGIKDIVNAFFFKSHKENDGTMTISGLIDDDKMDSILIKGASESLARVLIDFSEPVRCKITEEILGQYYCEVDDLDILYRAGNEFCSICGAIVHEYEHTMRHSHGIVCINCCGEYGWA